MVESPNVLLIVTDQERYDVTAPSGLPVETPAIDRLANEGMHFERANTPISICSSARASLLTGLYPHNHGMLNNCHEPNAILEDLPPEIPTFSGLLADNGYDVSYVGKWHVGRNQRPEVFGFDHYQGGDSEELDDTFDDYQYSLGVDPDNIELQETVYAGDDDESTLMAATTPIPVEATLSRYYADLTIDRLRGVATGDRPFFHRLDFPGPHFPYVVPEPYAGRYDPAAIDPWLSYAETFDGKPHIHEHHTMARGVEGWDWDRWSEIVSKYFGYVSLIDSEIGRVLDAVEELGLANETVVVHTTDHGDFTGGHRQFNKGPLMYEETYHIPLQVRWPGVVKPGTSSEALVNLLDLMPTFLEIAGIDQPEGIDGHSICPQLNGANASGRDAIFAEFHGDEFGLYSQRMVRTDEHKFVYNTFGVNELYDLEDDPGELHNRINHPEYRDVNRQLRRYLLDLMDDTDDPLYPRVKRILDRAATGSLS